MNIEEKNNKINIYNRKKCVKIERKKDSYEKIERESEIGAV